MPEISEEFFQRSQFLDTLESIIRNGDPDVQTAATIRRELEQKFNFEEKALDEKPWKKIVNRAIDTTFARIQDEEQEEQSQEPDVNKEEVKEEAAEEKDEQHEEEIGEKEEQDTEMKEEASESTADHDVQESKEEEEEDNQEEEKPVAKSEDEDFKSPPPAAQKKRKRQRNESPKSDDVEVEESPKKKRGRKDTDSSKKDKISQSDETIKRLKMYINKCGVRKSWQKELAGCKTKKDQIDKLKSILEDLGVEGRPTLEKCQKVKAERELKAEIESLDTSNILRDNGGGRKTRQTSKKRRRIVESDEEGDTEEEKDTKKKPDPGFDTSFLGDQGSDSD
ncbi:hypothetical protein VTP01DRAFT_5510 [Rhizomucor pusillus]|uniref:uncharacterized protein n=1 Tax=Rhizomucor pusillus TaxID=4840 RepID=UPI0037426274